MFKTATNSFSTAQIRQTTWLLIPAAMLVVLVFIAASQLTNRTDALDDLHWTIAYLTAAVLAWYGVYWAEPRDRDARRWFAYGLTISAIAQLCWDVQSAVDWTGYPAPSDVLFMCFGPCSVIGVWRSINSHPSRSPNWPLALDALTLTIVVMAIVLALYLPRYGGTEPIALTVMVIYPISMLASSCLTLVMVLTLRLKPQASWLIFTIACLLNGMAWMEWIFLSQTSSVAANRWLHLSFSLVTLLMGVGAMLWRVTSSTDSAWVRRCELYLRLLPLLVVGTVLISVALARWLPMPHKSALAIYVSAVLIFLLTMVRQSLLLFDRERLLAMEKRSGELEQNLRLMAHRLDIATRSAGIGIFEYQPLTDTLLWDQQMHVLFGTHPQRFNGSISDWLACIHADDRSAIKKQCQAVLINQSEYYASYRVLKPDGSIRYMETWADIQRNETGLVERMVGVNWDVTVRKEAEASQERLETQLRQSQKLEAIGTLASGIAHDFNNILGTILGNSELALQDISKEHPANDSVQEIRKAGQRARELIRRIVAFGKPHDLNFHPASLAVVIEDTLKLVRATLPATVEISWQAATNLPPVNLDCSQIAQMLLNLCTNANQAMPQHKGIISLALALQDYREMQTLPHSAMKPGQYLCLVVSDTGCGIDPGIADRIFEPFFTTKAAGEGSGLGLAIVHNIIRAHGGAVLFDSAPNKGTRFCIYLPVAADAPRSAPAQPLAVSTASHGNGQNILYVDDEEALVFLTTRMLERLGYRVSGFCDAELALRAALAHDANFDLIITDQSMPGMSGIDLAREVLGALPEARIVLVSGYLPQSEIDQAFELGIQDVLLKPDTVDELAATVHKILSAQPGLHRAINSA